MSSVNSILAEATTGRDPEVSGTSGSGTLSSSTSVFPTAPRTLSSNSVISTNTGSDGSKPSPQMEESSVPSWDSSLFFQSGHRSGSSSYPSRSNPVSSAATAQSSRNKMTLNYNPSTLNRTDELNRARYSGECSQPGCGKTFKNRAHLIRHERMHSGEKPFVCPWPYCMKPFSRKDNMTQHYSTHNSQSIPQHNDPRYIPQGRIIIQQESQGMPEQRCQWIPQPQEETYTEQIQSRSDQYLAQQQLQQGQNQSRTIQEFQDQQREKQDRQSGQ